MSIPNIVPVSEIGRKTKANPDTSETVVSYQ
jgi:hypothetical protein